MARCASVLLDEGDDEGRWRGGPALGAVVARGQDPDPARRHPSPRAFASAWARARGC